MTVSNRTQRLTRRTLLTGAAGAGSLIAMPKLFTPAIAQTAPLKVGLMLPYTGTFAKLGQFIDDGFKLYLEQHGGKLGGREIAFVQVDDESKPEAATDNMNRLVGRDKADVVIGTVAGLRVVKDLPALVRAAGGLPGRFKLVIVGEGPERAAIETKTLLIIPNAGANDATGPACGPNIFRTSFSNWQTTYPMGKVMADAGIKNVVSITWRYTAGAEMVGAFSESYTKLGGKIVEDMTVPFPEVEFQALITRIATLKPDAVFSFFAGGGAVKFVKDYAAAGLNKTIPLYGPGFLTDGTLEAQGAAA